MYIANNHMYVANNTLHAQLQDKNASVIKQKMCVDDIYMYIYIYI